VWLSGITKEAKDSLEKLVVSAGKVIGRTPPSLEQNIMKELEVN